MTDNDDLTVKWRSTIRLLGQAIIDRDADTITYQLEALNRRDLMEGICAAVAMLEETRADLELARAGVPSIRDTLIALTIDAAKLCDARPIDVTSKRRSRNLVTARRITAYAAKLLGISSTQIGAYFQADHTTIVHHWGAITTHPKELTAARKIAAKHGWRTREEAA